jgi:tetratricopeptide (TPR) repeat protein
LNESVGSGNDLNLAMNLAVLANIHHTAGDNTQALVFSQRALTILERCVSLDSLTLASIINNMGAIQMELGLFSDARHSLDRALKICEKTLLPEHPKRVTMEQNIQHIKEIIEKNGNSSKVQS